MCARVHVWLCVHSSCVRVWERQSARKNERAREIWDQIELSMLPVVTIRPWLWTPVRSFITLASCIQGHCACVRVCVYACVRVCVCACVRVCVSVLERVGEARLASPMEQGVS